jgi:PST family polysaccharide transporter
MIASIAGFATRRWDNLLVSHYYGTDVLGLYNLAYNLAEVPAVQVAEMVADVLASSFARLEGAERRKSAVDMVGLLSLTVFPLAVGLGLVAPTVAQLLPRRWAGIAPYLAGLSILSLTRPVGVVLAVYLQALRRPVPAAALQIFQVALLLLSIMAVGKLLPNTPTAVSLAVCATFTIGSLSAVVALKIIDGVPILRILWVQAIPLPALLLLALAVKGVDMAFFYFGPPVGPVPRLMAEILMGGLGYVVGVALLLPTQARRLLASARAMRKKGR